MAETMGSGWSLLRSHPTSSCHLRNTWRRSRKFRRKLSLIDVHLKADISVAEYPKATAPPFALRYASFDL